MNLSERLSVGAMEVSLDPVISLRRKTRVGVEGVLHTPSGFSSVEAVRDAAHREGALVDFDRVVRRLSLQAFGRLPEPRGLLFLNFDTAILDRGVEGSGELAGRVAEVGLSPSDVAICFHASRVEDAAALNSFVARHRDQGFLLGLKGVGEGHSNFERLLRLRPDVLKLSADLTAGIENDFLCREIAFSLLSLSRKMGALMVAEGVDSKERALACLSVGLDMAQGTYWGEGESLEAQILPLADELKKRDLEHRRFLHRRTRACEQWLSRVTLNIQKLSPVDWPGLLARGLEDPEAPECVYLLDDAGFQITETVLRPGVTFKKNPLFRPAHKGADHSLKEYYYLLADTFVTRSQTAPYVSSASGHTCVTFSALVKLPPRVVVVCADFPVE